jgi:WD40 repeat protein
VFIWDVATGHELLTIRDEKSGMYGVAFSPDGRRLATASKIGGVRLLDGTPLIHTPPYDPLAE